MLSRIIFMVVLFGFGAVFTQAGATKNPSSPHLIVNIKGVKYKQGGEIVVNLYQGEKRWLEPGKEFLTKALPITGTGELQAVFPDVPYNQEVAIHVFHDQNKNGKLDFRWFPPKPAEGVGVSNNMLRMGKPEYAKAKISLKEQQTTLQINMQY